MSITTCALVSNQKSSAASISVSSRGISQPSSAKRSATMRRGVSAVVVQRSGGEVQGGTGRALGVVGEHDRLTALLAQGQLPHFTAAAAEADLSSQSLYEFGLGVLLDGLAARIAAAGPGRTPPR
ncbi:hypothetical protein AB0I00_25905 [Streptomyces sp. NPDC050803]|uniref:hypothetical protein n=1 Tax=unclassified Streptomyces TaxID=2593676 RepID=UPI00341DD0AE